MHVFLCTVLYFCGLSFPNELQLILYCHCKIYWPPIRIALVWSEVDAVFLLVLLSSSLCFVALTVVSGDLFVRFNLTNSEVKLGLAKLSH